METKTILYFSFSDKHIDYLKLLLSFSENNKLEYYNDAKKILELVPSSSLMLIDAFDKSVSSFIRRIREESLIPIVCFVKEKEVSSSIMLHDAGADIVVDFNISTDEFKAQITPLLKRTEQKSFQLPKQDIALSNARIDIDKRTLIIDEELTFKLIKKEFQLLVTFIQNVNTFIKREDLLILIWGEADHYKSRSMDVYLCHVRKYINKIKGVSLANIFGEGYKLEYQQHN